MRAIKEELGDNDDDEDDLAALERKMQSAGMPSNIWKHAQRELRYDLRMTLINYDNLSDIYYCCMEIIYFSCISVVLLKVSSINSLWNHRSWCIVLRYDG